MPKLTCLLACVLFMSGGTLVLPTGAPADQPARRLMLHALDTARAREGLRPLRLCHPLSAAARDYSRVMIARDRWAHARDFLYRGFVQAGEILARIPGSNPEVSVTVNDWLASPEHRPILLDPYFRCVGIGRTTGMMGGVVMTVWVVRFER